MSMFPQWLTHTLKWVKFGREECCTRFARRTFMFDSLTFWMRSESRRRYGLRYPWQQIFGVENVKTFEKVRELVNVSFNVGQKVVECDNRINYDMECVLRRGDKTRALFLQCFKVCNYCSFVSADSRSREIHVSKLRGASWSGRKTISARCWGSRWPVCRLYLSCWC